MSSIFDRVPVPKWRIVLYGLIAAAGVASLGYLTHDPSFYVAAVPCGFVIGFVGIVLSKTRTMKIDERVRLAAPQGWSKPQARPPRDF
jgi:hypothetical protein